MFLRESGGVGSDEQGNSVVWVRSHYGVNQSFVSSENYDRIRERIKVHYCIKCETFLG
jgi:hypothetical protein